MKRKRNSGQATVEYIFILAFALFLGSKTTEIFKNFFRDEMGKIGHVLSTHLIVGICPSKCFYDGYENRFR